MSDERPQPIIRGQQVWLRATERDDLPLFVRWFNDRETITYLAMRSPMSMAAEERWYERMQESEGKAAYHFVICLLEDDRPIGTIGLFEIDTMNGTSGIGISIGEKSLWGKGYGTDALLALLDFGFGSLRLERVWLEVIRDNPRAIRSYEKCGFTIEGTQRHAEFRDGRYIDLIVMSILRDEWLAHDHVRAWDVAD